MIDLDKQFAELADTSAEDSTCDFVIDEDLRIIAIPERGVALGVEGDKDANRIRFRMNKTWRGYDMSKFDLRINYQNANGDKNYYTVTSKHTEGNAVVFDWIVAADAVAYQGDVFFIVVGLITTGGMVNCAFHTTLGKAKCLEGLVVDTKTDISEIRDFMATLKAEVEAYGQTFVNAAAASAKAAKASETTAASSASAAKTSETNAKASEDAAKTSETKAKTSETNAKASENAAKTSETNAKTSETNAKSSETKAAASADNAKTSETNAKASADSMGTSVATCTAKAKEAEASAGKAAASEEAAKTSEGNAKASETEARQLVEAAKKVVNTDKTLTIDGAPADAKTVGDKFKSIKMDWNSVTDKPETFPSTWDSVSGKPSSYPPSAHTHSYITNGGNVTAITSAIGTKGVSLQQVYTNGYPTSYGNVLSIGGSGDGQILAGWSGSNNGIERLYYRNRRDCCDTWSDWRTVAFTTDITQITSQTSDPGAGSSLATGSILLVYV